MGSSLKNSHLSKISHRFSHKLPFQLSFPIDYPQVFPCHPMSMSHKKASEVGPVWVNVSIQPSQACPRAASPTMWQLRALGPLIGT